MEVGKSEVSNYDAGGKQPQVLPPRDARRQNDSIEESDGHEALRSG